MKHISLTEKSGINKSQHPPKVITLTSTCILLRMYQFEYRAELTEKYQYDAPDTWAFFTTDWFRHILKSPFLWFPLSFESSQYLVVQTYFPLSWWVKMVSTVGLFLLVCACDVIGMCVGCILYVCLCVCVCVRRAQVCIIQMVPRADPAVDSVHDGIIYEQPNTKLSAIWTVCVCVCVCVCLSLTWQFSYTWCDA